MAIGEGQEPPTRAEVMALRKIAVVKPWHDMSVIQAWPRPRGRVKSARQQAWVDRFSEWACATKSPDAQTYDQAKEWARGTGWFWRDVLTSAMAGKLVGIIGETKITTPTAYLERTTNEALAAGGEEAINMTTFRWDNNGFWTLTPNPSRMLCKSPGLYLIGASAQFQANATDNHNYMRLAINGTTFLPYITGQGILTQPVFLNTMSIYYMHANDYIELRAGSSIAQTLNNAQLWIVAITPEAILP